MLEPATPNPIPDCIQPPLPPIIVNDGLEFEISEILDSKIDNRRHACKLLYLFHWTGYEGTDKETSWIIASELGHASELIVDFHSAYPAKSGPLSSLWLRHISLQLEALLKLHTFYKSNQFYLLFYSLIVESSTSTSSLPADRPPSRPWAILLNSPF